MVIIIFLDVNKTLFTVIDKEYVVLLKVNKSSSIGTNSKVFISLRHSGIAGTVARIFGLYN